MPNGLKKTLRLCDVWRDLHGYESQFTWKRKSRRDYWLVDKKMYLFYSPVV